MRHFSWISGLSVAVVLAACSQDPARVIDKGGEYYGRATPYHLPAQKHAKQVTVATGDSVYSLASAYNVPIRSIIDANKLQPPYKLKEGRELTVPRPQVHIVQEGETLYSISRSLGVDMSQLTKINGLSEPYSLTNNQELRIPQQVVSEFAVQVATETRKVQAAPTATVQSEELPEITPTAIEKEVADNGDGLNVPMPVYRTSASAVAAPSPFYKPGKSASYHNASLGSSLLENNGSSSLSEFIWPVNGTVVSRFGPKKGGMHNDGINIKTHEGAKVKAASDGYVVYAGNELKGYGNLILIRHDNNYLTAYAHQKNMLVKKGQRVLQGQVIGEVGKTGNVKEAQLHFGLRKGRKAINPEQYLTSSLTSLR